MKTAAVNQIVLKKVRVHNLKAVDLTLDKNELVVFTGISGSGKSSLAFDTLYAEGQRRYVESLSIFARRQMEELSKPDLESATGLTPTISIEQKNAGRNPRSTVGTLTEIYDYLRLLYARVAEAHCPVSGDAVTPQTRETIIRSIQSLKEGTRVYLLAPFARAKKGAFKEELLDISRKGFTRVRIDGKIIEMGEESEHLELDETVDHDIDIVIDRLIIEPLSHSRIADSVVQALEIGKGLCSLLDFKTQEETLFSTHAYSSKSGIYYPPLEPQDFSFNSPSGMCTSCQGLGLIQEFALDRIIDETLSIAQDCCSIASSSKTVRYGNIYRNLAELYQFDLQTPWKDLSLKARHVFLYGTEKKWTRMHFVHPVTGAHWADLVAWRGVLHEARHRFNEAKSSGYKKKMEKLMTIQTCPDCHGNRLKPYPAAALLGGKKIWEVTAMSISACRTFFNQLSLSTQEMLIAKELLKEISERLEFLIEVGLHYLTLNRTAPTLSGGESQRVRLASQIGSGLVGITYVLDEPSIGLHPTDNKKLINTLQKLRNLGNSVIVVEHDEETIWAADRIVDFGPGAGSKGGEILINGTLAELVKVKNSLTADYLTGRKWIAIPEKRRPLKEGAIEIFGASHHNLKNIHIKLPLGCLVAVTGVSGSGKSSWVTDILYPALSNLLHGGEHSVGAHQKLLGAALIDKVIAIDQTPIGRTPRSNPATYIKVFDEIRDLFSQLPESRSKGYKPGRFSFNVKEGSCSGCGGLGMVKVDLDFLEESWVSCDLCKEKRFDPETLAILFKGKSIYDILEMDVAEALLFFQDIPSIRRKLELLDQVGMSYIKIGQSSTTLSGGEAQRIKLAKELVRPSTGKTLYILDEPTTGLHFHDIQQLLSLLQALVDKGNSVVVIEHNMDLVKTADWVIDMGPEGGDKGGQIIAQGTPEEIATLSSPTAAALHEILYTDRKKKIARILRKKKILSSPLQIEEISITSAEQNNLKKVSACLPRNNITICSGPSGSGKSSFAFDTLYAEGQRRYVESLSPYARQFVKQMPKPKAHITGLSPAIAIEQKFHSGNPRSTVGTMTEVYDFLRILYARIGIPHCPETGEEIQAITKEWVVQRITTEPADSSLTIMAPIVILKHENVNELLNRLRNQGFLRIRLNGTFYHLVNQEGEIPFDPKRKQELYLVIDRIKNRPSERGRLAEALEQGDQIGQGRLLVLLDDKEIPFSLSFAAPSTGKPYPPVTPKTFAFNSFEGMCPDCEGIGIQYGANLIQNRSVAALSTLGFLRLVWREHFSSDALHLMLALFEQQGIDPHLSLGKLPQKQLDYLFRGIPTPDTPFSIDSSLCLEWIGFNEAFARAAKSGQADLRSALAPLLQEEICPSCLGGRLHAFARSVTINKVALHELCALPIEKALFFLNNLKIPSSERKILEESLQQLLNRLHFLIDVGLGYLSLSRSAPTLSGGEAQRIRLARQLGSGLTGVLYVVDEPTIGLHPRDTDRINQALKRLKELGNTLVLVEHDPLTLSIGDYFLDFGPKAGSNGGEIVARGSLQEILDNPNSLTGAYLSGKKKVPIFRERRKPNKGYLKVENGSKNNLKKVHVKIPVGSLTCISGVSGSGKSTLLSQVILPAAERCIGNKDADTTKAGKISGFSHFDKIIWVDQNPIGNTARSEVGTYIDLLPQMRELFAALPLARSRGFEPKHFSSNHRRGMCTTCWGMGYRKIEMQFLPPVRILCEECKGMRLNRASLEILYEGKHFGEYLDMTVEEVRHAFENHPKMTRLLDTLISVGLGYLKLGQETASLSGGEAQRLKLSRDLAKRSTGKTLYLLDEPTTGLHSDDIVKLLDLLQRLVDKGNTIIAIEHQLDFLKNADHLIEMGPGPGESGGQIVCEGTPEKIAASPASPTGPYLLAEKNGMIRAYEV